MRHDDLLYLNSELTPAQQPFADYQQLVGQRRNIADALAMPGGIDIEFEPDVEALHLQRYDAARDNLKEVIEGRDEDYATIIRSLVTKKMVSDKLREAYPAVFNDEILAKRVERAVLNAFELLPDEDEDDDAVPHLDVVPR